MTVKIQGGHGGVVWFDVPLRTL